MEKDKTEDTKILFLEIDELNKDFCSGKYATKIIDTQNTTSQVVFNNNDCFVHLTEVNNGFHISAECMLTSHKSIQLMGYIDVELKRRWKSMLEYYEKHKRFNDADCKFYNYVNGDYSRFSISEYNSHIIFSYRLFVDNLGFNYEKCIKLGMFIVEMLQSLITSIVNKKISINDFLNILIHNLFDKLTFLDTY